MLDEANLAVPGRYYTERCDRSSILVMSSDAKSLPVKEFERDVRLSWPVSSRSMVPQ